MSTNISDIRLSQYLGLRVMPGDMSRPPNRIRFWREKRGLSRAALGEQLGCHHLTVEKLERGKMEVTLTWLQKISSKLGVAPSQLLDETWGNNLSDEIKLVPFFAWDEAEREVEQDQILFRETVPVASDRLSLRATRVVGNAMNKVAPQGTAIIYDIADCDLIDKSRYLLRIDGSVAFRTYRDSKGPRRFEPESNVSYETIYEPRLDEAEIIGKVLHSVADL